MKSSRIIAVLLGLNLGLAGLVAYLLHRLGREETPTSAPAVAPVARPRPSPAPPPKVVTVVKTNEFHWAQLESENYRDYIARLRSIGCPEQTIRDIVIADVDKLLAPRRLALAPGRKDLKYWEPSEKELESYDDYRNWQRQELALDFEKRDLIKELMGFDLVGERMRVLGQVDYHGNRLGFLPEDKRAEVRKLLEQMAHEEVSIREKTWQEGEALTDEDHARLKQLRQGHEAALGALLSPEELERYRLELSPQAYAVRDSLFGMDPTEQEYLALFQLRTDFDKQWPEEPPDGSPEHERWTKETGDLESKAKAALGEARYAEYQRAKDPDYRELRVAAARYKVPEKAANEVYSFKQVLQQERARVQADPALTTEQKERALQAAAAETERLVRAMLGDRAFNYYRRSGQGGWIGQ